MALDGCSRPYRPASRIRDIAPFHVVEVLTRARQLEAAGRDVIHMEVGEPDFPTPDPIVDAARKWLPAGRAPYTPSLGLPELREAIAGYYASHYGVPLSPSRVVVTPGASGALLLAFACLTEPGSRWLLADPGYPCNRNFVTALGGRPQPIAVDATTNFQPTAAMIDRDWSDDTAGVLVASPANPTGTAIAPDELSAIAETVRRRGGTLVVDEIYHGLTYGFDARTAVDLGDDIFVVQSFSKYWQMTGWRLGWMIVPERYQRDIEKLAQNLYIAPSTPAQYAALAAFSPLTLSITETRRKAFQSRRDALAPAMEALGFRLTARPEGAFYLYLDCGAITDDSYAFSLELLEATGVAITPGIDFGSHLAERHVRIAYTVDVPRLIEAADRIRAFIADKCKTRKTPPRHG